MKYLLPGRACKAVWSLERLRGRARLDDEATEGAPWCICVPGNDILDMRSEAPANDCRDCLKSKISYVTDNCIIYSLNNMHLNFL